MLVHPADNESFGRVVVEAMAAGLPVVGVRGGGVGEIVSNGETGLLSTPDDPSALAENIDRLIADADLRARLGTRAAAGRRAIRSELRGWNSSRLRRSDGDAARPSSGSVAPMKFSICIPNYNYERYLGRTIQSVLDQQGADLEVVVSDNASTDRSVEIVRGFADPRIRLRVNRCNVGFAGNLDRAARMAEGDWMNMLSSDDLMRPGALATYRALFERIGATAEKSIATCDMEVIDSEDRLNGHVGLPRNEVWRPEDRAPRPR